jgi:hypothetical protein
LLYIIKKPTGKKGKSDVIIEIDKENHYSEEDSKIFFKEIEPFIREYIINNFFNTIANYSVIWNTPVNKEEDAILVAEKFTTMQKDEYKKNILYLWTIKTPIIFLNNNP